MVLDARNPSPARGGLTPSRPAIDGVRRRSEGLRLADGYETLLMRHTPDAPSEATPVLYLHGIQSHPGWYVGSADALASTGREVFQVARRGSGAATHDRGCARNAAQLLDDVDTAIDRVTAETGAKRVALLGVSWAGKLLIPYAIRRGERIASLTLAAPGLVPKVGVSVVTKLSVAASLLCCRRRKFDIPLNDVTLFTDNEVMREYLLADPHRLVQASAGLLLATAQLDRMARRGRAGSLKIPTTLLLASRDRIVDNDATRRLVDRLSAGEAEFREFDACHTLEFEPDVDEFFEALRQGVSKTVRA